ncbi:MAG: MoaE-MoaD fusion protein [Acidobacteriaceae bacterium]|jgi:molybdopterin converting factor subunit 1
MRTQPVKTRTIQIEVLFFGMLKDLIGKESDALTLNEGATVNSVIKHYQQQTPRLTGLVPSLAVSVNQEYAGSTTTLHDGDEVALLPPVSGGLRATQSSAPGEEAEPRVAIVREGIDTNAVLERVKRPEDGAVVVFEGIVRDNTLGRRTLYLDYEAYEEMALKQMDALAERALAEFKIRDAAIVHRLGRLEIGETSVLIVVASAHRAAAFDASRWLIDTLKRTVPIWKKEHFEDGIVWADGEPFPEEERATSGTHSERPASK